MKSAHRVLAFHFALGLGNLALLSDEVIATVVGASPADWALIAVAGMAFGAFVYHSEHRALPERAYGAWATLREHPVVLVALAVLAWAGTVVLLVLHDSLSPWFYDVVVGVHAGLIGYRVVYGLVRPVPEVALERF